MRIIMTILALFCMNSMLSQTNIRNCVNNIVEYLSEHCPSMFYVVDMNGRVVMSDSMSCEGDCVKTMEVSGLAQGAYFVRINGENVNMVKKLVVK